jgi:hypothetical protein
MPISRLLAGKPVAPGELERLTEAFELTLRKLSLVDRDDPVTEIVAKKIIELGQGGADTPAQLAKLTIESLGIG